MSETDFQALFHAYQEALRGRAENPVPQKIHLMIYNYARLRHQQTSDVAADFYLHMHEKIRGILDRYDARRLPLYQYLAASLNFEFNHFLRRRRLPRSQLALLSVEELAERRVELQDQPAAGDELAPFLKKFKPMARIYGKLVLALPLNYGELRYLVSRGQARAIGTNWATVRAYREFLHFNEKKRQHFVAERDRLLKLLTQLNHQLLSATGAAADNARRRQENARKKFFSMDTRIPIRIVAAVTGDSIATAQRQLKSALGALQKAYTEREKKKLGGKKRTK